ncbi:MAG: hypothetical protein HZB15_08005 [Actinobacteria bacterium]|nr:hypothetical protein [Actinomycetota bacterium]
MSDGEPPTTYAYGDSSATQLWALDRDGTDWGDVDPTVGLPLETDLAAHASRWVFIEFGPGGAADMHTTDTGCSTTETGSSGGATSSSSRAPAMRGATREQCLADCSCTS